MILFIEGMDEQNYRQISNTIWNIANLLRGGWKAYEYQDVILPLTVLKRLDAALEPTKQKTLERYNELDGKVTDFRILRRVTGYDFYNVSPFTFKKLLKDPRKPLIEIVKYIDMNSVRVVRKLKASIALSVEPGDLAEAEIIPGAPPEEVEGPLSELLDDVNKRWGVEFGKEQQETLSTMGEELASNNELQDVVANNVRQNASIHFEKVFDEKVDDQFDIDRKLWEQLRNNRELNEYIQKKMFRYVSDKILALREQ